MRSQRRMLPSCQCCLTFLSLFIPSLNEASSLLASPHPFNLMAAWLTLFIGCWDMTMPPHTHIQIRRGRLIDLAAALKICHKLQTVLCYCVAVGMNFPRLRVTKATGVCVHELMWVYGHMYVQYCMCYTQNMCVPKDAVIDSAEARVVNQRAWVDMNCRLQPSNMMHVGVMWRGDNPQQGGGQELWH